MTVVVFTPVRQTQKVFRPFVDAVNATVDVANWPARLWYWDDGAPFEPDSWIKIGESDPVNDYRVSDRTHHWSTAAVDRVAHIKNLAARRFLEESDAEWLFMVDSDVVVQPDTLRHLISLDRDVVSAVYWTQWQPHQAWMPQVWDVDSYSFLEDPKRFLMPGHWPVGGLGACTLIRRSVLEQVEDPWTPIPNLTVAGEDRWFCIRATVAGIKLTACTCVEAQPLHLYRKSERRRLPWTEDAAVKLRREAIEL